MKVGTVTSGHPVVHKFDKHLGPLSGLGSALPLRPYDWYGFYGHRRNPSNSYDEVQELYNGWDYSEEVHGAIAGEVKACRTDAAIFDQSSFGKGGRDHPFTTSAHSVDIWIFV